VLLDGRLQGLLRSLPGKGVVDRLLDAVLATTQVGDASAVGKEGLIQIGKSGAIVQPSSQE
jgi:hypothetical protein